MLLPPTNKPSWLSESYQTCGSRSTQSAHANTLVQRFMAEQAAPEITEPIAGTPAPDAPAPQTPAPETPALSPHAQKLVAEFGLENVTSEEEVFERAIAVHKQVKDG